jgi:hypothetical protein
MQADLLLSTIRARQDTSYNELSIIDDAILATNETICTRTRRRKVDLSPRNTSVDTKRRAHGDGLESLGGFEFPPETIRPSFRYSLDCRLFFSKEYYSGHSAAVQ